MSWPARRRPPRPCYRRGASARRASPSLGSAARSLLLLPTTTYRPQPFVDAARPLGADLVCASERPSTLEAHAPDGLLTLDFDRPAASAETAARFAAGRPLDAVVGVDDRTAEAAAAIAERLRPKTSAPA